MELMQDLVLPYSSSQSRLVLSLIVFVRVISARI